MSREYLLTEVSTRLRNHTRTPPTTHHPPPTLIKQARITLCVPNFTPQFYLSPLYSISRQYPQNIHFSTGLV